MSSIRDRSIRCKHRVPWPISPVQGCLACSRAGTIRSRGGGELLFSRPSMSHWGYTGLPPPLPVDPIIPEPLLGVRRYTLVTPLNTQHLLVPVFRNDSRKILTPAGRARWFPSLSVVFMIWSCRGFAGCRRRVVFSSMSTQNRQHEVSGFRREVLDDSREA